MKTAKDPRHQRREKAIRSLFKWSFQNQQAISNQLAQAVIKKIKQIDKVISQAAPEWPIEQINKIDLAILRLAIYELTIKQQEPPKVIIDEAVELAKAYGSEKSSAFANGVLGTVYKNSLHEHQKSG
ncbi:transcription antitermination factor NusB [Candidatus Shapirobacteria bacterium CG10_big_fil_rev_8_21_14_0_10_48_15]|uniref:Transcription antitermination protein NusB n=1 Tax=Candidatus Shapirobacteria bacterium CG10_big_fil_rev_8_21_14_0_10_48_15 TaxID=1974484 RepID=A0A2M8L777_9BACT|nr:MAG: transcription antitermination factor NusB [Candidatus Shapirobacteria bacterium CG10_big_fil_rev_8_21_14_0_10_48_15]